MNTTHHTSSTGIKDPGKNTATLTTSYSQSSKTSKMYPTHFELKLQNCEYHFKTKKSAKTFAIENNIIIK